jgi:hypothetical protein
MSTVFNMPAWNEALGIVHVTMIYLRNDVTAELLHCGFLRGIARQANGSCSHVVAEETTLLTMRLIQLLCIDMTGKISRVKGEPHCWIVLRQAKEGVTEVGRVERRDIAVDQIGNIEPDFVEAESLAARVP